MNRYVLRDLDYRGETLFKVKGRERDYIFATDEFRGYLAVLNISGLQFREVATATQNSAAASTE